jgi:kumamolisin
VFAQSVEEDVVDVLSVSWGAPEVVYDSATLSIFDVSAFDVNRSLPVPDCSTLPSVDFPGADLCVLAACGTTLPNSFTHEFGDVTETVERAWGWDHLGNYIVTCYGTGLY